MDIEVRKPTETEKAEMTAWPIWTKEPSTFDWHYDQKETCLLIEGLVEVQADGNTVTISAGDVAVFPQGLSCTWKVVQPVRKHYKFG